ncbi:MAG: TIGR00725 family protein [Candidatus Gygaella obscura]|nr:TIGR00725 family protein [Candidatus Gygaella obscura]
MKKTIIAVIGGRRCNKKVEQLAHDIGKIVSKVGAVLVCGGMKGVMEASCKGARVNKNSLSIGILPGDDKEVVNPFVDIAIPTGMGIARNILVVKTADIVIAIDGKYGTLSEIAIALQCNKPVLGFGTWDIKGVKKIKSIEELEKTLLRLLRRKL